jgi:F-type H+-transporting ATPase subunit delta
VRYSDGENPAPRGGVKADPAVVLEEQEIEQAKAGGVTAVVTSAILLTDAEKDVICEELENRVGKDVGVSFRVDPDFLGGLILRAGDRVIDGTEVGQLERLQESLV